MEVMGKVLRDFRNAQTAGTIRMESDTPQTSPVQTNSSMPKLKRSRVFGASPTNNRLASSPLPSQSIAAAESLGNVPRRQSSIDSLMIPRHAPVTLANKRASQRIEQIMSIVSDNPVVTPLFEDSPAPSYSSHYRHHSRSGSSSRINSRTDAVSPSTRVTFADVAQILEDDDSDVENAAGYSRENPHLEPPAARVPGILDAPFVSGAIPKGDEQRLLLGDAAAVPSQGFDENSDSSRFNTVVASSRSDDATGEDLQNYTYIHPALVGRLPVAWLDLQGGQQPDSLVEARREQVGKQRMLVRRIIGMQRAGVEGRNNGGGVDELLEDRANVHGGNVRQGGSFFGFWPLIDGVMGWANMS
ncbi:hypothetical protein HK100_011729 [Physocladia obscura]|uniref:Uncharacterized protein n=1 Tax=Physocladia obscura TaxID=109957 RepID=A0AAD5XD17_9FUNG|nr:hypothetical protein HK100_011729 [Physocladia obscura]